jgi:hypothetical protein
MAGNSRVTTNRVAVREAKFEQIIFAKINWFGSTKITFGLLTSYTAADNVAAYHVYKN